MITKQEARLLFLADSDIKRICFRIQRSQELQRNQDLFSEANMRTPFDLFFFTAFELSAEILGLRRRYMSSKRKEKKKECRADRRVHGLNRDTSSFSLADS